MQYAENIARLLQRKVNVNRIRYIIMLCAVMILVFGSSSFKQLSFGFGALVVISRKFWALHLQHSKQSECILNKGDLIF